MAHPKTCWNSHVLALGMKNMCATYTTRVPPKDVIHTHIRITKLVHLNVMLSILMRINERCKIMFTGDTLSKQGSSESSCGCLSLYQTYPRASKSTTKFMLITLWTTRSVYIWQYASIRSKMRMSAELTGSRVLAECGARDTRLGDET